MAPAERVNSTWSAHPSPSSEITASFLTSPAHSGYRSKSAMTSSIAPGAAAMTMLDSVRSAMQRRLPCDLWRHVRRVPGDAVAGSPYDSRCEDTCEVGHAHELRFSCGLRYA